MSSNLNIDSRLCIFPLKEKSLWDFYKKQQACMWTAEEIDMSGDKRDFDTLSDGEKNLVKNILAFFAASDTIVNANLANNFIAEIDGLEVNFNYSFQQMIECVHSETYALQIDVLISDEEEKERLFNSVRNNPAIRRKAAWAFKYMNKEIPLHKRLFAFALVEGLHFQSSFASIAYFRTKNKMSGLVTSNDFIARDEGMHAEFSCQMFKRENEKLPLKDRLTQAGAEEILRDAVLVESSFVREARRLAGCAPAPGVAAPAGRKWTGACITWRRRARAWRRSRTRRSSGASSWGPTPAAPPREYSGKEGRRPPGSNAVHN